jgi:hypothetical protein
MLDFVIEKRTIAFTYINTVTQPHSENKIEIVIMEPLRLTYLLSDWSVVGCSIEDFPTRGLPKRGYPIGGCPIGDYSLEG